MKKTYSEIHFVYNYSEVMFQFGFVTFFAAAMPMAPVIALLANPYLIKGQIYSHLYIYKRPMACMRGNIEPWYKIWILMGYISIITNFMILYLNSTETHKVISLISCFSLSLVNQKDMCRDFDDQYEEAI